MDYDTPIEGLRALDRYTLQVKLNEPSPTGYTTSPSCRIACAIAREVVEKYSDDIVAHPVGTGAYRLTSWKRSSKMVFEPIQIFARSTFKASRRADDKAGQAISRG